MKSSLRNYTISNKKNIIRELSHEKKYPTNIFSEVRDRALRLTNPWRESCSKSI